MAIGQDIAKTFILPQQQIQRASLPGSSPVLPQKANQAPSLGFDPAEELILGNEKLVQDYYDKYNKLRSFASMMNSAGIDVTAPDFDNPASIEANQLYQKAAADLMRVGDMMKEMRKTQVKTEDDQRAGVTEIVSPEAYAGIYGDTIETARAMPIQFRTSQIDLAPEVKELNLKYRDALEDKSMLADAFRETDKLIRFYQNELNNAESPAQRKYAQRQLNGILKPMYDPNKDQDQSARWDEMNDKKKEKMNKAMWRMSYIYRIMNGEHDMLKSVPGVEDVKYLPSGVIQIKERISTDSGIPQYKMTNIDMSGARGKDRGTQLINNYIERMPAQSEENISYEDMKEYEPLFTDRFGSLYAPDVDEEYYNKIDYISQLYSSVTPSGGWTGARGPKNNIESVMKITDALKARAIAGDIEMPMGIRSKSGVESRGVEKITDVAYKRGSDEEGGNYISITANTGRTGAKGKPEEAEYRIPIKNKEQLELFFNANPEVVQGIQAPQGELGPPEATQKQYGDIAPISGGSVVEFQGKEYTVDQLSKISSAYKKDVIQKLIDNGLISVKKY